MKYRKIYDREFISKLPDFDKYDNPGVVSICRRKEPSIKNFRLQVERWFQNLPEKHKSEMYKALRSLDNGKFLATFYELMIYQYCIEEGWDIIKHPSINGKTPDFKVKTDQGDLYLEVLTIFDEKEKRKHEKKYHDLLRKIGLIKSDFLLSVHINKWLELDVDFKKIQEDISSWINNLEKVEGINNVKKINKYGFTGSIFAKYYKNLKPINDRIVSWGYPIHNGPSLERIKSKIRKKLKKYKFLKKTKAPLVIVACFDEKFFWESAIDWSLYGKMTVSWDINNPKAESKVGRDNSGLITPNPGLLGEPKNKLVSAVLVCSKNWDKERMTYSMKVFHNPWSLVKLSKENFKKMPQFIETKRNSKYITLKWINDKGQVIVFN